MSRRWPGSSSGSASTLRPAAATAPGVSPAASRASANRSRRSATVRSTRAARAACQSSKFGLSRREKPARNGPRARAAARSRSASRDELPNRSTSDEIDHGLVHVQRDAGSVDQQPAIADCVPQRRQGPPERAARRLFVRVRPEHHGEFVPGERPTFRGDDRDDRHRLARVDDDRSACDGDLERTEESDRQRRGGATHGVTVPDAEHIP